MVAAKAESVWKSIKRARRSVLRQPTTPPRSCIAGQWGETRCDRIRKVMEEGRRAWSPPAARPPRELAERISVQAALQDRGGKRPVRGGKG